MAGAVLKTRISVWCGHTFREGPSAQMNGWSCGRTQRSSIQSSQSAVTLGSFGALSAFKRIGLTFLIFCCFLWCTESIL